MKKQERFQNVMNSIEQQLLEEVQVPMKKQHMKNNRIWQFVLPLAACVCVVAAIAVVNQNKENSPENDLVAENNQVTEEELLAYGYDMRILQDANEITYSLIEVEEHNTVPMMQAEFLSDGNAYVYRAFKTEHTTDISGNEMGWKDEINWSADGLDLQMATGADERLYVSWYDQREGMQCCLSTKEDSLSLMTTASRIMFELGYDVAVAPEGATDITYDVIAMDDMTIAETTFMLEGIRYTYRVAGAVWITDISGNDEVFETEETGMVGWCDAQLYYTENAAGKALWYDFAPGLMYSLSVDDGATAQLLLEMADQLYEPAQQEVG